MLLGKCVVGHLRKVGFVCDGEICGDVLDNDFQLHSGNTLVHVTKGDTWIDCDGIISGNIRIVLSTYRTFPLSEHKSQHKITH